MYLFDELFQFVNCNENCDVVEMIENLFNDRKNHFQINDDHVVKDIFERNFFVFNVNQKLVKCNFCEKKLSMREKNLSICERNRSSRFFILDCDISHDKEEKTR